MLFLNGGRAEARPCPAQIRSFDVCDSPAGEQYCAPAQGSAPGTGGILAPPRQMRSQSNRSPFRNDERRQNFDHIHIVTGNLRENPMPAQQRHHDKLRKEPVIDPMHHSPSQFHP